MDKVDFEIGQEVDLEVYGTVEIKDLVYTVSEQEADVSMEISSNGTESVTTPAEAGSYRITVIDADDVEHTLVPHEFWKLREVE